MKARQRGATLIISLLVLTLMTLIGVTAMQSRILEEKMAGNLQEQQRAFQAAEAALRAGEALLAQDPLPAFDGDNGLLPAPAAAELPYWRREADWWRHHAASCSGALAGVAEQPRYVIEELPAGPVAGETDSLALGSPVWPSARTFRITARGVGGSEAAVALLQTTYRR